MPIPFPGMGPYLEEPSLWDRIHDGLVRHAFDSLNAILPLERYSARLDRHAWLEDEEADSCIIKREGVKHDAKAPLQVRLPYVRCEGGAYIVISALSGRAVTVLTFVRPEHKQKGFSREAYRYLLSTCLTSRANFVECDLLRAGERTMSRPLHQRKEEYLITYSIVEFETVGQFAFGVRVPIPPAPVPLGPGDLHLKLDLKACLDRARSGLDVDYARAPTPPLNSADAEWATALLSSRTREGTN